MSRPKNQKADVKRYEYVKAIRDLDGNLRWEAKLKGASAVERLRHDEDVADFSNHDLRKLTRLMLSIETDDPVVIQLLSE